MDSQIRRYSNDYLNIGISARDISMSNSVVSSVKDFSSVYYNSAGLGNLSDKYEVSLMHSEYFAGIAKYDYGGFSYKLSDSTGLGLAIVRMGIDNIQNTLYLYDNSGNINYDNIELFSVADYALMLAIGKKAKIKGLSYGLNAKILYRSEGEFAKAYGFGIDIGFQYKKGKFCFGANLKNATTTFTAWFFNVSDNMREVFQKTNNELPKNSLELTMPVLDQGVSCKFKFSDKYKILAELGSEIYFDGKRNAIISFSPISIYPQIGFEASYKDFVYIRGGVNNFQLIPDFAAKADTSGNFYRQKTLDFVPSIGLGIRYKSFYVDYSLTDIGNLSISLYSHIFSISYYF
jgi:hypothetical protein